MPSMKGLASPASAFAPFLVLLGACASTARPAPMPEFSLGSAEVVSSLSATAALDAGLDIDDDAMRIPRPDVELPDVWPASGLYLGAALITTQPMGDFDGDMTLSGPTDLLLVPDLDVGGGGGVFLSYRWRMNELVVQYAITENDGEFSGSPQEHDATFYDLDMNWRHYFMEKSPLQPYSILGLGWSRLEVDNGSTDQATGTVFEDAEIEDGIVINVGAGAALYTLPWVVFFGQGIYRFVRYETSNGIDGHLQNTPDIDGDGWTVSVGAALRILPPRK